MRALTSPALLPYLAGLKRWLFAIGLALGALAIRPWLNASLGTELTFVIAYPAVAAAAWYGGAGPGLLTAGMVLVGSMGLVASGVLTGAVLSGRALVFGIGALAIAAMGEQMQRARASLRLRAEHAEERARLAAEREAALAETRRTASLLQSIMDYVPEGITVAWGPEAKIALVSRHGLNIIQKQAGVVTKLAAPDHPQAWEVYTADGKQLVSAADLPLTRACRGEVAKNEEYLIRAADGSFIPVLCDAGPIRDESGAVTGGIIAWRDITERKKTERALHEALEQLDVLLVQTPLAVVCWDEAFRITRWTGQAEALFGWSAHEVLGKSMEELGLVYPDDAAAVADTAARLGSGNEPYVISRNRNLTKSGLVITCVWYNSVLPKAAGGMQATLSLVLDVTEQERTQRELATANATKDTFLATLAHELRNPLAPLHTTALMLRTKAAEDASLVAMSGIVERQVNHIARLLDDLVDVSRVAIRRLELQREPTLLANVLSMAIEQARPALDAAQQELVVDMPTDQVHAAVVSGDKARLVQAFANLLQNAAKYSSGAGEVHVGLHVENGTAHVDVKDTGIGIDPQSLTSIFGLFVQGAFEQPSQRGGLGIGLALVKGIVELHGGRVTAYSEGPGTGSAFRVSLPVTEAIPAKAPRLAMQNATGARLAILVIDDNRDSADSLAALLRTLGHTVNVSYDGKMALGLYDKLQPNVVLLDISLPDVSGYDIAQHIRRAAGGENVLLIAVTGWVQVDVKSAAAAAGFDHHLAKPVNIEALLQLLSAYHRGKRSDGTVETLPQ